ncbi:MAG: TlpA disulfide reductase family protein [Chitinophagaceae bacterium]|jgi:peroxiredoxin
MRIVLLILFFIPYFSFGQETALKIEIFLKGMPDGTFFYLNEEKKNVDSSFSKNETLIFKYYKKNILPAGILVISKDRKQGYLFWIENESIKLQGIYKDLSPLITTNSKTQNEFREYMLSTTSIKDSLSKATWKFDSLRFRHNSDSNIYQLKVLQFSSLLKQTNIDFIKKYPSSIISTQTLFFEAHHKRFSNEEVLSLFKLLSTEQQNSSLGQGILKIVLLYQNPLVGQKAPDFTINDSNGNPVSLSNFKGKKIVLIFWASWCGPCIKEMPEIIKFQEKNRDTTLVFIAVSLDEQKDSWLTAIQKHSIPFINVSDLKGWMCEPALIYGVSAIPENFLIDDKGNIVLRKHDFDVIKKKILDFDK